MGRGREKEGRQWIRHCLPPLSFPCAASEGGIPPLATWKYNVHQFKADSTAT